MKENETYDLDKFCVQGENLNLMYDHHQLLDEDFFLLVTSRGLYKFYLDVSIGK